MKVLVAQSCPTLCSPMDCSPPGSSVHGILQARILEWVAAPFSRGDSPPRDRTQISCIAGRFFTIWATREARFDRNASFNPPEFNYVHPIHSVRGLPGSSAGRESACSAGNLGSVPGSGRSPGEGNGYPLQYSGLENPMDSIVHGITKCQARLSDFHSIHSVLRELLSESLYFKNPSS